MDISPALIKTMRITMDAIFKASKTDVRVHNIERVPKQPVLYVINHFTRMETFVVPYVLKKYINQYPISLAHESFFGGGFGNFLSKLGAISTKDPERDKILIRTLLLGNTPVIIFPEGQMIKDKKLVERGKFMVYNMGIRRPPHTGAARIALMTEFYRRKIRSFLERGDRDSLTRYKEYFGFDDKDIASIVRYDTVIVPINLTYFPIRARINAINRLAERFSKNISARMEEELEVEGTMLIDGVDIDMNFGHALYMRDYLFNNRKKMEELILDCDTCLDIESLSRRKAFARIDVQLMMDYMSSIYGMTTVNHDHIFSFILGAMWRNSITESDFKNRAFLAIKRLLESPVTSHHTSLLKKQFYLLTDDPHDKYQNFIQTAVTNGLVTVHNGVITRNRQKFNRPYRFHSVRKDNILEVMKNEIEPLTDLVSSLNRLMWIPAFWLRRMVRKHFVELDQALFDKDYQEYYIEGESKPRNIGAPFFLRKWFSRRGIVLVHGYMAAPEEIRELAEYLHGRGFSVYGVRLRGHGTAPEDLARRNWEKWYDSASRGYIIMKNTVKKVSFGGFSTGAGIALLQAAAKGDHLCGVVSISAPLHLKNIAARFSSVMVAWNSMLKKMNVSKGRMDFVENHPDNPNINYLRNPINGVRELEKLMTTVGKSLADLRIPTLIIQGSGDPVVDPRSAQEIFDLVGTDDKELFRVFSEHHGIVRGPESEKVKDKVSHFLDDICSRR